MSCILAVGLNDIFGVLLSSRMTMKVTKSKWSGHAKLIKWWWLKFLTFKN